MVCSKVYSTPSTTSGRNFQQRIIDIIIMDTSHSTVDVMHHDAHHAEPAGLCCGDEARKAQLHVISISHSRIETSQLAGLFLKLKWLQAKCAELVVM